MKAKITKVNKPRFSRNGDVFYQRVHFQLQDGRFAMTDLVSSFRNFAWWKPIIESGPGTILDKVDLKDESYGKPFKVDADSRVEIIQPTLGGELNWT